MDWVTAREHTVKTWIALTEFIQERLARGERGTFLYGDLAQKIFGFRNKGAQSFGYPLGNISERIETLNRLEGAKHPYVNALVYDREGEQTGIPRPQNADEIWAFLEGQDASYLDRLGKNLGYRDGASVQLQDGGRAIQVDTISDLPRITRTPGVMQGKACIRGMRVTVGMILGNLSAGVTVDELLKDFPYLEREDIMQALSYASWLASEREIRLVDAA